MKKCFLLVASVLVLASFLFWMVPSSQAQSKEEKQFMKEHKKEMTTFMEKCSGCHSLQRMLSKLDPRRNGIRSSRSWRENPMPTSVRRS